MSREVPQLALSAAPFQKRALETPAVMRHVLYSLVPVMAASAYYFGVSAVSLLITCVGGAVLTEWLCLGRGKFSSSTVMDGSAAVTGALLALTLPPGLPLWMALLGSAVAVIAGKLLYGGLGQNIFNPSLTGRAFLQACFPEALTTWCEPRPGFGYFFQLQGPTFSAPFTVPVYDGLSAATPLARMKFEAAATPFNELFFGRIAGSAGETCALLILCGGVYLAMRRLLNWRIPVGALATVFVTMTILHAVNPERFGSGAFHLFAGGLMLGAVFMATDPATSPVTPMGCWLFAFGFGLLVVAIRQFGGLAEGVMYAILLMNALVPLIDRYTQPRIYGAVRREGA